MQLRGVNFGYALNASGARNFDGSGWWYHRLFGWTGLDFEGATFVAKTTTLESRAGNMALYGLHPVEKMPECIKVYPWKGVALNAVGLSGPGAEALLQSGIWQAQMKPFFLSFMSIEKTATERMSELFRFVGLLAKYLPFQVPVALQMNFSCPNVGLNPRKLISEIREGLTVAGTLGIPLVPKVNVTFPHDVIMSLLTCNDLDAICVSNTIPWGHESIDWQKLFGTTVSPLAHFGGGGLSGKPLLPLVVEWIRRLRQMGFSKPIIGGGGILSVADADSMIEAGADAVELGSVAMLRPWRVRGIVRHVNHKMGNGVG